MLSKQNDKTERPLGALSAYFKLAFKKDIPSSEALKEWEELNDRLDICVAFQFDGNGSSDYFWAITGNDGVDLELVSIK